MKERSPRGTWKKTYLIKVDIIKIDIKVSIDRITLAKTAENALQAAEVENHDDVPSETVIIVDKYVVERNARYMDNHEGTKYLLRWYVYGPTDDT